MTVAPGTRLGTYEVVAPLGAGGMGEVYRARDTRLGREVALKVLPEAFARDAGRLARFEREARTVAGLNHPNIVVLYSVEEEDGVRFLTMELVEGQTLDTQVAPDGLSLARVLDLGIALADALVAAHEKGVVHRDLKPANVMVTRDGRVKVLDFGLAKLAGSEAEAELGATRATTAMVPVSTPGLVVGTVPYMAPEQIRGEAVDARTDLFALGIILYELATGRRPFVGTSPADVISAILRDEPAPVQSVRGDLPRNLDRIITRCLEKGPRDRFQAAQDVYNELRVVWREVERGTATPVPVASATSAPGSTRAPAPPGEVPSVAVLPFVNRSRDEEDEYFSDGLADELIDLLAKIRGLRVAARASAFQFKGKNEDPAVVGRKLNVKTLLDGSVRKAGNRVRISVQLVRVSDGDHLWSETYDRRLEDIFAVQDDIAHSVVEGLRVVLLGEEPDSKARGEVRAEVAAAARGRGTDAEAHRLYLQSRHFIDRFTREDLTRGIGYLQEALALDPGMALAWAALGGAYAREADAGWVPVDEGYGRARQAVERALSLEPELAEAHAGMAWIQKTYDWDWRGAEASYARALELAPGKASVLRGAGVMAQTMDRGEEAIGLHRRGLEQDPLSGASYSVLGYAFHAADRLAEAEAAYRKALEISPQRVTTRSLLASVLLAQGRGEEALAEAMREPDEMWRLWALAIIYYSTGYGARADEALQELVGKHAEAGACQIAEVHATRGAADAAFEWLERAYAQRDPGLTEMKSNPRLRSLHGDPRWGAFLIKMGFMD